MSVRKYQGSIFLAILMIAINPIILGIAGNTVTVTSDNTSSAVTLAITDSYYTDLDGDEVLDVVSYFDLDFEGIGRHVITIDV